MSTRDTSVAVVGGGVGGLTAAHELAERGVDVAVHEANDRVGGKARSLAGPDGLPAEHGFRFFPAFYRHVTDTMGRIPYRDRTVLGNLVPTERTLLARVHGPERTSRTVAPATPGQWLDALAPDVEGLTVGDARFFAERLLTLLTSCEERRREQWDEVSWWEFLDASERSEAFKKHLAHATQALVALRPERGSARTIGLVYLQLLLGKFDPDRPTERVLNGPTSEVWFDPWVEHLEALGVSFDTGARVVRVESDGRRVTGLVVETADGRRRVEADQYVLALPLERVRDLLTPALERAAPSLGGVRELDTAWMNGVQFYLSADVPLVRGHGVYLDSPWALTSISQGQFWTERGVADRHEAVEGVLSVIVSDWETPGLVNGKPARECTRAEIVEEVWAQLTAHLDGRLHDELVVEATLDPAIVETDDGLENRSPLLVNTVGSLKHRPEAATACPNLSLAADYVRTNSDLASMESANEAGRRAANAVLSRIGSRADPCELWSFDEPAVFEPFKRQDAVRYRLGLPHPGQVSQSLREWRRRLRPGRT